MCITYEKNIKGTWVPRKGKIVWNYTNQLGNYSVIVEDDNKKLKP
jgi:hypothetical protein